jgi:hypothetical protein
LIPQGARPPSAIEHAMIQLNYTTWLDFVAFGVASWLLVLKRGKIDIKIPLGNRAKGMAKCPVSSD